MSINACIVYCGYMILMTCRACHSLSAQTTNDSLPNEGWFIVNDDSDLIILVFRKETYSSKFRLICSRSWFLLSFGVHTTLDRNLAHAFSTLCFKF